MPDQLQIYSVHQNLWPLVTGLGLGCLIVFFGAVRWGPRFGLVALPIGLLIPASQFLVNPALQCWLPYPEIMAWNAGYWLVPASLALALGLGVRRATRRRRA